MIAMILAHFDKSTFREALLDPRSGCLAIERLHGAEKGTPEKLLLTNYETLNAVPSRHK